MNLLTVESPTYKGPTGIFINGEWRAARNEQTFATIDPSNGRKIVDVAEGTSEDIDLAVHAARAALESGPWPDMKPNERARVLWRLGDLILEHADELAEIETLDNGKPLSAARLGDVPAAADMFHYMSGWVTKLEGKTIPVSFPGKFHAYTVLEPVGVVGLIIPWNFPLTLATWKLAPALAAGNTVVLKPAEQTPLSALRLAELTVEAGIPRGVVNVVPGFGETAGAAIAAHPGIDKVSFTGSTETGRSIVRASMGNFKKLTLELGGKSPNIILPDADLGIAIDGAADAIFGNQGEACVAGSRLFVHESNYDEVLEGVVTAANSLQVGNGRDSNSDMGPLVSSEHFDRVTGFVAEGLEQGATLATGGTRIGDDGFFLRPTVFTDVRPGMRIVADEIFGPVVVVSKFSTMDDIVRQANDTIFGLGAGIWTRDISNAHILAKGIKAGSVWVNCYNLCSPAMPFGGYKESGWGREMGFDVMREYTETKSVCIKIG